MQTLPLILASSSTRRRQLLEAEGLQFTVITPRDSAEDGRAAGEAPPEFVARQALQKARDAAQRISSGIVIGCDTVAECGGQILGKPADRDDARRMLETLRGREHHVYSGLCLWRRPDDLVQTEVAITRLIMDAISDDDLTVYLATVAWCGKAGAFGYQDGIDWVHIVEGSESNVVGLPLELLRRMMPGFC